MPINIIYDDCPSSDWADCFPLGNGRIGAMVRGGADSEIISFNHDLLWRAAYSGPYYRTHRDIDEIKRLCLNGKYNDADHLLKKTLPDQSGVYINPFVPFCDLYISLLKKEGEISDYRRSLDIEHGIAFTEYSLNGVHYSRECFCSLKYGIFAMKISSLSPVSLCGELSLSRITDAECDVTGEAEYRKMAFNGRFSEGRRFSAVVKLINRGGRTLVGRRSYSDSRGDIPPDMRHFGLGYVFDRDREIDPDKGTSLIFDSCDELIVLAALSTDSESDDPHKFCETILDGASDYETIKHDHEKYFSSVFNRTRLDLNTDSCCISFRESIDRLRHGNPIDNMLVEAGYNMSRYLMISSGMPQPDGRTEKAPINLQGLWCRDTRPAWESDYHLDLNIQMCYWPVAAAGLPEWYEPYISWLERLLPSAKCCAAGLYGCNGAAYNGCCDPWTLGGTDTVGFGFLGAGPWLMQMLWIWYEHYPSPALLKRIYSLMEPVAVFCREMLTEDCSGRLTYPFGSSPEMAVRDKTGLTWIASASVCDITLTKELFAHMAAAERTLGSDSGYDYTAAAERIVSPIRDGEIGEWTKEHEEAEPGHRHRSPFICFCPGSSISFKDDPTLTSSLKKLFLKRTSAGNNMSTSFSYVWDAQILARLHEAEDSAEKLRDLFRIHLLPGGMMTTNDHSGEGGIGWFEGVKVVQADASMGLISSVTEMICQDNNGYIEVLPALPKYMSNGKITGLHCRGGFTADMEWKNGDLKNLRITSENGGRLSIMISGEIKTIDIKPEESFVYTAAE